MNVSTLVSPVLLIWVRRAIPNSSENTMIGTIVAVDIASKMLVDTKFNTVSCQPSASCAESCRLGSTSSSNTMPVPGLISTLSAHARTAATIEKPSIHLKVRTAIFPVPVPVIEPVATITDAITNGTIDI